MVFADKWWVAAAGIKMDNKLFKLLCNNLSLHRNICVMRITVPDCLADFAVVPSCWNSILITYGDISTHRSDDLAPLLALSIMCFFEKNWT